MDFHLITSFLVHVVLLPPASLFLLVALGWLLESRHPRLGKTISRGGVILLYLLCIPVGATLLIRPLESLTLALARPLDANAQAIVVLAAGRLANAPEFGGQHQPDYIALARLRYAAHLQHATGLPLLVTGGNVSHDMLHESKAVAMARALQQDFRTPVRWIEGAAETTAENAGNSARILQAESIHRILLVTDAMHMARSVEVFRQAGLDVVAAPTVFLRPRPTETLDLGDFIPTAEALRQSYYAIYEWVGLIWYRLQQPAGMAGTTGAGKGAGKGVDKGVGKGVGTSAGTSAGTSRAATKMATGAAA